MHLDREHFPGVEKFKQQGESTETRGQLSQQLLPRLLQQLGDGLPFKGSIGNSARMVIAVTEYLGFANRAVVRQGRSEQVGQAAAAPKPVLIDWFKSEADTAQYDLSPLFALLRYACDRPQLSN